MREAECALVSCTFKFPKCSVLSLTQELLQETDFSTWLAVPKYFLCHWLSFLCPFSAQRLFPWGSLLSPQMWVRGYSCDPQMTHYCPYVTALHTATAPCHSLSCLFRFLPGRPEGTIFHTLCIAVSVFIPLKKTTLTVSSALLSVRLQETQQQWGLPWGPAWKSKTQVKTIHHWSPFPSHTRSPLSHSEPKETQGYLCHMENTEVFCGREGGKAIYKKVPL